MSKLSDLGGKILHALEKMSNDTVIDEVALKKRCFSEISMALYQSIIEPNLIKNVHDQMGNNFCNHLDLDVATVHKIIQQIVFNELCKMLYTQDPFFVPEKRKTSVLVFLGAQGLLLLPVNYVMIILYVHGFVFNYFVQC